VEQPLLSALKTRSFSSQKATPTSRSAVRNAARQESQSGSEAIVTEPHDKCSPQYAPSAVKAPKFLFNLVVIDRFTAAIVTGKTDPADKKR